MDKEFKDFLIREYQLLFEELYETHQRAYPDDTEMRNRVEKAQEELNHFLEQGKFPACHKL
tara:strand:+ start:2327 stop:2509 length:183 start_codon:yes stop_codon:yes gene_type:complete